MHPIQYSKAGFSKNFSTIDRLQALKQFMEKNNRYNLSLIMALIDHEKAFVFLKMLTILKALNESVLIHDV